MKLLHPSIPWLPTGIAALTVAVSALHADPILRPGQREHIRNALHHLNLREEDMGFEKDVADPRLVLPRIHQLLASPLELADLAEQCLAAVNDDSPFACWATAATWLADSPFPADLTSDPTSAPTPTGNPPHSWSTVTDRFRTDVQRAYRRLEKAHVNLDTEERQYLAAAFLGDVFLMEDHPAVRRDIERLGIPSNILSRVITESHAIDPRPAASAYLDAVSSIDMPALFHAVHILQAAVERIVQEAARVTAWPSAPVLIETPLGTICVGTCDEDVYSRASLLILDPGGDDTYTDRAGSAVGLIQSQVAVIVDLAGNDTYHGTELLGPGAALFGLAWLYDRSGDDTYRMTYTGLGAGLFGAAGLTDDAGDDMYQALALTQGAGYVGIGILRDKDGNDRYDAGYDGQAYAGVQAVGLLIDDRGNDVYTAGGKLPDYDRHTHRHLSMAQGFAIGMRPFAGGGIAALVDRSGNDTYVADVFGQGVSYWYAAGMLLDEEGHDSYQLFEYGQGSAVHLSLGLLSDRSGNDTYSGFSLAQGSAHDYAVGILLDNGGNDTYTADHYSQGMAINNALGLLLDDRGNDHYFAANSQRSQGIGNDGGEREYGSLALLLDLAGKDLYSCTAPDGARVIRPNHGIIYDVQDSCPVF